MYYLLIAAAIWVFAGCGEDGKGAPTEAGDNAQTSAVFADTSLEAAVRQALKQPSRTLREEDLAGLGELEARGRGIVSLQGIGQLPELVRLDLADNRIADLAPLASLSKLQFLDLDNNQVRDLSALAGLGLLEVVVLGHNLVQDLTPLLGLGRLRSAEVSGNPLSGGVENAQLTVLQEKGVEVEFQVAPEVPQNPSPESPVFGAGSRLAFVGYSPEGQRDIYTMDVASHAVLNLTNRSERYMELAWSPDGKQIAFTVEEASSLPSNHVFVMAADGGDWVQLTLFPGDHRGLVWAPGPQILVFRPYLGPSRAVFALDAAGGQATNLSSPPSQNYDRRPVWSPDGSQVAFIRFGRLRGEDVYVINADGTDLHSATHRAPLAAGPPAWSPDGREMAFALPGDLANEWVLEGVADIFRTVTGVDTLVNLTDNPASDIDPAWSPEGTRIAFSSDRDGNWEVYMMGADGSNPVNLSRDPGQDFLPKWSPDGSGIVYVHLERVTGSGTWLIRNLSENSSIAGEAILMGTTPPFHRSFGPFFLYWVKADGGQPVNLTDQGVTSSGFFAWAPR